MTTHQQQASSMFVNQHKHTVGSPTLTLICIYFFLYIDVISENKVSDSVKTSTTEDLIYPPS